MDLARGDSVSLTSTVVTVGFDWDAPAGTIVELDVDFFNNLVSPDGTIEHAGDSEQIVVRLVDATADRIVFSMSIYDAYKRKQSFEQVADAHIRIVGQEELARYDLTEDALHGIAIVCGELYRDGAEWRFRAVGEPFESGLDGIARSYGVDV